MNFYKKWKATAATAEKSTAKAENDAEPIDQPENMPKLQAITATIKGRGDTKPAQGNANAAEPATEKLLEADDITSLLEIAVILEDVASRSGYKFARNELRRLLTAANDAENEGNRELFIQAVSELKRLMRA